MKKTSYPISNLHMSIIFFNMNPNLGYPCVILAWFWINPHFALLQNSSCLFLFPRKILNQSIHELLQPACLCK